MVAQRLVSSNYLGVGLAIATGVAANLGWSLQAQAQTNLNLQTQINIVSPPLGVSSSPISPSPSVTTQISLDEFVKNNSGSCVSLTSQEMLELAIRIAIALRPLLPNGTVRIMGKSTTDFVLNTKGLTDEQQYQYLSQNPAIVRKLLEQFIEQRDNSKAAQALSGLPAPPPKLNCDGQPVTAKINFPFNPTYETDVLKSGSNSSSGASAGFGGNFLVTGPGLKDRPFDLIAFGAGSASARYNPYPSKSLDTASSQVTYQAFLDAYTYDGSNAPPRYITKPESQQQIQPQNLITIDTLSFAVQNQTAFMPTYKAETADLLTPQVTLGRQNMDLSANHRQCSPIFNPDPTMPNPGYCYYADFAVTVGQTFSDMLTQQNSNIAGSATFGWRIDKTDWKFTVLSMATARDYQDVVGGRHDLLLQSGPALTYTPNKFITLTLPVTYYKNYSSVSAAAWSGVVVQPTLTIAFSP
jgi:hypothetical protein